MEIPPKTIIRKRSIPNPIFELYLVMVIYLLFFLLPNYLSTYLINKRAWVNSGFYVHLLPTHQQFQLKHDVISIIATLAVGVFFNNTHYDSTLPPNLQKKNTFAYNKYHVCKKYHFNERFKVS